MHEVMKENEIHNEVHLKENSKLELVMAENIKLKEIIKQLKKYIKEL